MRTTFAEILFEPLSIFFSSHLLVLFPLQVLVSIFAHWHSIAIAKQSTESNCFLFFQCGMHPWFGNEILYAIPHWGWGFALIVCYYSGLGDEKMESVKCVIGVELKRFGKLFFDSLSWEIYNFTKLNDSYSDVFAVHRRRKHCVDRSVAILPILNEQTNRTNVRLMKRDTTTTFNQFS